MKSINITYLEKIVHEMNTPLHSLGMLPDIMLDENIQMTEAEQRECLGYIKTSAERLTQLAKMLSSITNVGSEKIKLKLVETNLIELINKEIKYHQAHLKRDDTKKIEVALNNTIGTDTYIAKLDSFWFRQLLSNLIINAINHMTEGVIEIKLRQIKNENSVDSLQIEVIDEGCGIATNELKEIFKPLKRGSHSVDKIAGSGIGLAVAKEVTEALGGNISADSDGTKGAKFTIILPFSHTNV